MFNSELTKFSFDLGEFYMWIEKAIVFQFYLLFDGLNR